MTKTKIEWADRVWNPVTGCTKISAGCKYCYAEGIANRFWGTRDFDDVMTHPEKLEAPLSWKKPARIFVNSMSDLFHGKVPDEFIAAVWDVMQKATWHTFIILTKRPSRMRDILTLWELEGTSGVADNIWLGVSVENQDTANYRIPILLKTPASNRIVSVEPMLERVNFAAVRHGVTAMAHRVALGALGCDWLLDWVICGCESGMKARPFEMDWARDLRDQCQAAGTPFYFKQGRVEDGSIVKMPKLDGKVWDQFPMNIEVNAEISE